MVLPQPPSAHSAPYRSASAAPEDCAFAFLPLTALERIAQFVPRTYRWVLSWLVAQCGSHAYWTPLAAWISSPTSALRTRSRCCTSLAATTSTAACGGTPTSSVSLALLLPQPAHPMPHMCLELPFPLQSGPSATEASAAPCAWEVRRSTSPRRCAARRRRTSSRPWASRTWCAPL